MAVDTRAKRASALVICSRWYPPGIEPDGVIDGVDRQQIGWGYPGILAAAPGSGVNTRARRASALVVCSRWYPPGILPDGAISSGPDRQQIGWGYPGIPVAVTGSTGGGQCIYMMFYGRKTRRR